MMNIGITQRVEQLKDRPERRDCLDQAWTGLLQSLGMNAVPIPNTVSNAADFIQQANIKGIILSGGNDLSVLPDATNAAEERDQCERNVLEYSIQTKLPLLGACRGLQFIVHHFGGDLVRVEGHVALEHVVKVAADNPLDMPEELRVNSFHNYGMQASHIKGPLKIAAICVRDDTVEAVVHESLPIKGIMWHPERCPQIEFNHQLLKAIFNEKDSSHNFSGR